MTYPTRIVLFQSAQKNWIPKTLCLSQPPPLPPKKKLFTSLSFNAWHPPKKNTHIRLGHPGNPMKPSTTWGNLCPESNEVAAGCTFHMLGWQRSVQGWDLAPEPREKDGKFSTYQCTGRIVVLSNPSYNLTRLNPKRVHNLHEAHMHCLSLKFRFGVFRTFL